MIVSNYGNQKQSNSDVPIRKNLDYNIHDMKFVS